MQLPKPILANLETLPALDASLDLKGTAQPCEGLYPRDGVASVSGIEDMISLVTIPGQQHNVIWASGMSAVRETVNFAACYSREQGKRYEDPLTIAHSTDLYAQSSTFFAMEKNKGVRIVRFDSGNQTNLLAAIEEKHADVVFAETVANTPDMPILDIFSLIQTIRELKEPPVLILDNTLPLSTGIKFSDILKPDDPVVIVESGTKNLMNNSELLGITYSPNVALIEALRRHKAHSGAVNSLGGLETLSDKLQLSIPGFHGRNRAIFNSTGNIALALAQAQEELGDNADFTTTFPTDPRHPNHDLAKRLTPEGIDFISPVAFITATDWSDEGAPSLVRRLIAHPSMREQLAEGQIYLGQSFGLPSARILYDRNAPNVRFAGGYDLADEDDLAEAIFEAAADK